MILNYIGEWVLGLPKSYWMLWFCNVFNQTIAVQGLTSLSVDIVMIRAFNRWISCFARILFRQSTPSNALFNVEHLHGLESGDIVIDRRWPHTGVNSSLGSNISLFFTFGATLKRADMKTTRILKGCPLVRTTTQALEHRENGIHSASYLGDSQFRCNHASAHANGPLSGFEFLIWHMF